MTNPLISRTYTGKREVQGQGLAAPVIEDTPPVWPASEPSPFANEPSYKMPTTRTISRSSSDATAEAAERRDRERELAAERIRTANEKRPLHVDPQPRWGHNPIVSSPIISGTEGA